MQIYHSFNEMAVGTGALSRPISPMSAFNGSGGQQSLKRKQLHSGKLADRELDIPYDEYTGEKAKQLHADKERYLK